MKYTALLDVGTKFLVQAWWWKYSKTVLTKHPFIIFVTTAVKSQLRGLSKIYKTNFFVYEGGEEQEGVGKYHLTVQI